MKKLRKNASKFISFCLLVHFLSSMSTNNFALFQLHPLIQAPVFPSFFLLRISTLDLPTIALLFMSLPTPERYRKVASSRSVYISILNLPFINSLKILKYATNQDSLLLAISQYVKTKLTNLTVQAVLLPTMLRRKRSSTKAIWKSKCHFFLNCIS